MKAVIYHTDTEFRDIQPGSEDYEDNIYELLIEGLKLNLEYFGIKLIHLTIEGYPAWGHETFFFEGDPNNIVYNREKFLIEFLKTQKDDDMFLLIEPDSRLMMKIPELPRDCDLALLKRKKDQIALSPWWRLFKKSSIPFFEEALSHFNPDLYKWHGDSWAYVEMYKKLGMPVLNNDESIVVDYNDMKIQLREYELYSKPKSKYIRQFKSAHKAKLIDQDVEGIFPQSSARELSYLKEKYMASHRHIIDVDKTYLNQNRLEFFKPFVENKKVLHIGYADWPKTRPHKNLHLQIAPLCTRIDGLDYNVAEELKVPNGELYSSWNQISNIYDTILIPEVIEHVDNVKEFLEKVDTLDSDVIITAPDAYLLYKSNFKELENGQFYELVHPDHNCWYSPYTLMNTINKYSKRKVTSLHWLMNQSIAAVCKK